MVRDVQQRMLPGVPATSVAPFLDSVAGPDDRLWPSADWPPIRFDRALAVGADGGHGPIRYWVSAYEPGRCIRFARWSPWVKPCRAAVIRPPARRTTALTSRP